MIQKCLYYILLVFLLFSSSCQKKQLARKPFESPINQVQEKQEEKSIPPESKPDTEEGQSTGIVKKVDKSKEDPTKTYFDIRIENIDYENQEQFIIIQNSGIIDLTPDWRGLKIGRASQDQVDYLKKQKMRVFRKYEWIIYDKKESDQVSNDNKILFTDNPYSDYWIDYQLDKKPFILTRFYEDINQDNIPEIFFPTGGGSGGIHYRVYQITQDGYFYLGGISYMSKQILNTKHNGFNDIVTFWDTGEEMGYLSLLQFDGKKYIDTKEMEIIPSEAIKDKVFIPDKRIEWETHPQGDKLLWSPKDDDKYRRMIK